MSQEASYTAAGDPAKLNAERVRFMYRLSTFGTVASTLVAIIAGGYFWWFKGNSVALGLVVYFVLIGAIRLGIGLTYSRISETDFKPEPWILAATVTMFFSGIGWGAVAWLLFDVDLPGSALIVGILVSSMVVSGMLLLASFTQIMLVFAIPAAAPLLWKLANGPEPYAIAAGILALVVVVTVLTAMRIQSSLKDSLSMALENRRMARFMADSRNELENLNDELSLHIENKSRVEEELRQAKRAAEAAAMSKDEFLATMSHEIRTPLNGILPILDILRSTRLDETQQDYLNTAFQSSKHLLSIIDDILDFSKIEAGKLELETVGLNLRELLDSVVRLMSGSANKKGLDLRTKIEPGVRVALRGDPVRLRQILANLVSNAIKFTESGYVEVTVSTRSETRDMTEMLFAVKDTGIGMDKPTSDRLFRPFSQADASTTRTYGGSGLGLAICKRLVELMKGKIGVKSEPGRGSVFWFSVNLKKSLGDIQSEEKKLEDARVLLGCGDDALRQRLTVFHESWGISATPASNLRETASKVKDSVTLGDTWNFDILVVDEPSLGKQTHELIRRVRKDPRLNELAILLLNRDGHLPTPLQDYTHLVAADRSCAQGELHQALEAAMRGTAGIAEAIEQTAAAADMAEDDGDQPALSTEAAAAPASGGSLSGRVLLVEDNPVNLHVAQKLLSLLGVEYDVAKNGKEATSQMESGSYNAVLMDCMMPVMDGYTATRKWREYESKHGRSRLPILAMTANAMAGDRQKCLDAGMDDYMAKPLNRHLLEEMLGRWFTQLPSEPAPPPDNVSPFPVKDARPAAEPQAAPPPPPAGPAPKPEVIPDIIPTGSVSGSALDRQILDDLIDIMGDEYVDLISVYLEDAPQSVAQLSKAAERKDTDGLIAPAHSLKSTSANLGAMALSEMAKDIELNAREGRANDIEIKIGNIQAEFKRVAAELETLKATG